MEEETPPHLTALVVLKHYSCLPTMKREVFSPDGAADTSFTLLANFLIAVTKILDRNNLKEEYLFWLMASEGSDHDCLVQVLGQNLMATGAGGGGHGEQEAKMKLEGTRDKLPQRICPQLLPPTRSHLLKFPELPKVVLPVGGQPFNT
jgi:hypothetical protein